MPLVAAVRTRHPAPILWFRAVAPLMAEFVAVGTRLIWAISGEVPDLLADAALGVSRVLRLLTLPRLVTLLAAIPTHVS